MDLVCRLLLEKNFFNDTATTEIYTLSLHDALPICIQFEWDENKNQINQNKHNISFEEAKTVFYDDEALVIDDPDHSEAEERFIILGLSNKANLLIVCHCYRASDTVIRIISARRATKTESKFYRK